MASKRKELPDLSEPVQTVISVNIALVKPNPSNPRTIKDEKFLKLVNSIKEFPGMLKKRPLVCFTDTDSQYVVLGGNMRLKAANQAGLKQVPIMLADDWTEQQKKEFLIKDNVGYGDWDWDELNSNWDTEQLTEWGLDVPFEATADAVEDDYEIPDEIHTDIVLGDLFEIGPHRLLCGDSTQTDTFSKLFGDNFADLVITDPPYNVAYEGKTKKKLTIENDKQGDASFYQFLYDFYTAQAAYAKAGGGMVYMACRFRRGEFSQGNV